MNWKFWRKEKHRETSSGVREIKLGKPRDLPQHVGMYLVTKLSLDPDWVWNLKCVLRPLADQKNVFEIRIFNPETGAAKGVTIANFNSLDAYPNMILFSGTFDKKTGKVQIEQLLKEVA
jgi:hypothetical protein